MMPNTLWEISCKSASLGLPRMFPRRPVVERWWSLPWNSPARYHSSMISYPRWSNNCPMYFTAGKASLAPVWPPPNVQMDDEVLWGMNKSPEELAEEIRLAAAVKWYEMGTISQERAVQLSGMSRAAFIDALSRFGASLF